MRGDILKGISEKMNGQFASLFHSDGTWPKLLVFVIIVFYVIIFTFFAVSYVYIFTGMGGSGFGNEQNPTILMGESSPSLKDTTTLSHNLTTLVDTTIQQTAPIGSVKPVAETQVSVNGNNISVPSNGSVHKEISTGNGTTSIDVSTDSSGSSNSDSTSSIDFNVSSSSTSQSEGQ